jgi:PAS domain S-box-containing protein
MRNIADFYGSMLKKNRLAMLLVDPERGGSVIAVSPSACDYFGYLHTKLLRMGIFDLYPLSEKEIRKGIKVLQSGRRDRFFFQHRSGNGNLRNIELHSLPSFNGKMLLYSIIHDASGKMIGEELPEGHQATVGNMKAAGELDDKYRRIFENTGTAMMISEANKMISLVNAGFERLTGYRREEVENKKEWTIFAHKDEIERIKEIHQLGLIWLDRDSRFASPVDFEFRAKDKSGNTKYVHANACFIPGTRQNVLSMLDITQRKRTYETIKVKSRELHELNTALKVLLKKREDDKGELEQNVASNIKRLILPNLVELKKRTSGKREKFYINVIESNLKNIISPLAQKLSTGALNLTPKEFQIADLIRHGKSTKEIADHLDISKSAIDAHRNNIRKKLGLSGKKVNLQSFLSSYL